MQINSTMPVIVGTTGKPKKLASVRSTLKRVSTHGSFQYSLPINRMICCAMNNMDKVKAPLAKNNVMIFHCSLRMDFVPDAPYRLDELITEFLLELVPQVADVNHDRIVGDIIFFLPDLLEDILGAKDSSRLTGKQVQNLEFPGRQEIARPLAVTSCVVRLMSSPSIRIRSLSPGEGPRCTGWSAAAAF